MRKLSLVLALAAVMAGMMVVPAKACSCITYDPRDEFARSDAPMTGTFVSSRPGENQQGNSLDDTLYTFQVTEDFKNQLPDTVDIHAAANGASCGLEVSPGDEYGLYVDVEAGVFSSHLCHQTSADQMRAAAAPLPEPTGTGPMEVLLGGSFGDQRLVAISRQGKVLAYGEGNGDVTEMSICPGHELMAEIVTRQDGPTSFAVRRLDTLEIAWEFAVPIAENQRITEIYCKRDDGQKLFMLSTQNSDVPHSHLYRVEGHTFGEIHEGEAIYADFYRRRAYLNEGEDGSRITRVNLRSAVARELVDLEGIAGKVAISPNGKHLAVPLNNNNKSSVAILRANRRATSSSVSVGPQMPGMAEWLNNSRFAFLAFLGEGKSSQVFDLDGQRLGRFSGWTAEAATIINGRAWGVDYDIVEIANLPEGPTEYFGYLPSPVTYSIVGVPGDVVYTPPPEE